MMKSDTQLKKEVLDELKWDPSVNANEIGVILKDGAVVLTGTVEKYVEKQAAERATKRVEGVHAIAQEIEVKLPSSMSGTDEQIAEQISHILKWSASLKDMNIQARVTNGYVTLTGEVRWAFQKKSAEHQIEDLQGVKAIINQMAVSAPVSPVKAVDIKRQITSALHRRANLEASKVNLSVADGKVTLDGSVDTYYERELIENTVWACSGVKDVVDHLSIV